MALDETSIYLGFARGWRSLPDTTMRNDGSGRRGWWLLMLAALWASACVDRPPTPAITFTRVPAAARGGPDLLDTIEGQVTKGRPDQRLVLYARNSVWWVQPTPNG
jgi:hypothetical protein